MSRITAKFKELGEENKKAFIAFVMGGDPTLPFTESLIYELEKQGVDMIEIGVPFSDPVADGPTIQRAGQRALKNHVSLKELFNLVKRVREKSEIPLLFMTYYNPVLRFGLDNFVSAAKKTGLDGLIIPDLTPEEAGRLFFLFKKQNLDLIFFVAPTSTPERIREVNLKSSGFVYCISLLGVTGERENFSREIKGFLKTIKNKIKLPIALGFGISTPKQVKTLAAFKEVSGVIVGSAIIKKIEENLNKKDCLEKTGVFVKVLIKALEKG